MGYFRPRPLFYWSRYICASPPRQDLKARLTLCFLSSNSSSFLCRIMSGRWSERESQATFKANSFLWKLELPSWSSVEVMVNAKNNRQHWRAEQIQCPDDWDGGAQLSREIYFKLQMFMLWRYCTKEGRQRTEIYKLYLRQSKLLMSEERWSSFGQSRTLWILLYLDLFRFRFISTDWDTQRIAWKTVQNQILNY